MSENSAETLKSRPTIEQAMSGYDALAARVRSAASAAGAPGGWEEYRSPTRTGCEDLPDDVAQVGTVGGWRTGKVPPAQWPAVFDAMKAAAATGGFATVEVLQDTESLHSFAVQGPDGAILTVMAGERLTLTLRSGCHPVA
ncbi:MAG: LppA family lipoprotein [Kineosporiaceae bacterium]